MSEIMDNDDGRVNRLSPTEELPDPYYSDIDGVRADEPDEDSPADLEDDVLESDPGLQEHDATDWGALTRGERYPLLEERFDQYRTAAEALVRQQLATDDLGSIPGYVDSGVEVDVFRPPEHPGIVLKLPGEETRVESLTELTMRGIIDGRVRGLLLPGHEQIIGYENSREFAGVACKDVPGTTLWDLSLEERELITDEHFAELVRAAQIAQENGIGWDLGTSKNFIHHQDNGLTVVDYSLQARQSLANKMLNFADTTVLLEGTSKGQAVPEYALRFRDVCGRILGADIAHMIEGRWRKAQRTFDA